MSEAEKGRLIENLVGVLSRVSREDIVERAIGNFRRADPGYGDRLQKAVHALRTDKGK